VPAYAVPSRESRAIAGGVDGNLAINHSGQSPQYFPRYARRDDATISRLNDLICGSPLMASLSEEVRRECLHSASYIAFYANEIVIRSVRIGS
jgi:hypothetical protein